MKRPPPALFILAATLFPIGCGDAADGTAPPAPPTASQVVIVSGDNQRARITRALPAVIVVKATSASGAAVPGAGIVFTVTSGSVTPASATADAGGTATTTWTLGPEAGPQSLTARLAGGTGTPATVNATADPALLVRVTVLDGDRQQVVTGTAAVVAPSVRVTEPGGTPVPDVRLRFTATGGTVAAAEAVTDATGRATAGGSRF
jgi:hypothetical protein